MAEPTAVRYLEDYAANTPTMQNEKFSTSIPRPLMTLAALAIAFGAACSSGGGGGGTGDTDEALLTLSVTDAASDELSSFVVELEAIRLTRLAGATVGILPSAAVLDFTTLTETSQILNMQNVPPGLYREAMVTLDFSEASCYLVGEDTPATIYDSNGQELTGVVELPIQVQGSFECAIDRHTVLELDFDLNQSVIVDSQSNSVTLEPAFVLRVDRTDPKEFVVVGALQSVDTANSEFALELQTLNQDPLGDATVLVDEDTVYQIDGVALGGSAGLSLLAGQSQDTWVQCYGALDTTLARMLCTYVEAGSGTYNGGQDIVEGHIIGRTGGTGADPQLIVLGHSNDRDHNSFLFNTEFLVSATFDQTHVLRRGLLQSYDTDDLNIGQRIRAFGNLSGTSLDASGVEGVIRMQPTRVLGFANAAIDSGELSLDLERVDLRSGTLFSWSEGGDSPVDPDALSVAVGSLGDSLAIDSGTAIEAIGFFSAFDDASSDFVASSLINRDLSPSLYVIHDRANGLEVSTTSDADSLDFVISGTATLGELAVIDKGFVGSSTLPTNSSLIEGSGFHVFVIRDRDTGELEVHLEFADFLTALQAELGAGATVYNCGAIGSWDENTATLAANLIVVVIE